MLSDDFSLCSDGVIKVKSDFSYDSNMKKTRVVKAIEEYIECPCGGEMFNTNMLNYVFIWKCSKCSKQTYIVYQTLNNLVKLMEKE